MYFKINNYLIIEKNGCEYNFIFHNNNKIFFISKNSKNIKLFINKALIITS